MVEQFFVFFLPLLRFDARRFEDDGRGWRMRLRTKWKIFEL